MGARSRRAANASVPPTGGAEPLIVAGLGEFAALVDEFAAAVNDELGLAGQVERQAIGQICRDTLVVQSSSIRDLFREVVDGLPADGQMDVERFWRASGAATAIAAARLAIQNPALARRSVLEWIKLILEFIKKIIAEILKFLRDKFPWLVGLINILEIILALLNILDNVLAQLNKILAGREPVDMARESREMWQGLEAFWRAKAAFMRLGNVETDRGDVPGAGTATS
jgi:hypothetical protein